jgi:glycosyltransferase involved in cell wall biosynthesis
VKLDVIIPTYHNTDELFACLRSLAPQQQFIHKVWVCVDDADPHTLTTLVDVDAQFSLNIAVRCHPDHAHRGRNATRNLGIAASDANHLLFLDSDLRASQTLMEIILDELQESPLVMGKVEFENTSQSVWADYYASRQPVAHAAPQNIDIRRITSQCLGMRREVVDRIQQVYDHGWAYGGDLLLATQLNQAGYDQVRYVPRAKALGKEIKTWSKVATQHIELMRKTYPELNTTNLTDSRDPYHLRTIHRWAKWVPIRLDPLLHWLENQIFPYLDRAKPSVGTRMLVRVMLLLILIGAAND